MAKVQPRTFQGSASFWGRWQLGALLIGCLAATTAPASGQDIEQAPIHYGDATPRNSVGEFQKRLDSQQETLEFDESEQGYLRSFLHKLDIPESSQVLVFSKTSMQRQRISPKTPRAIYFNDDVIVGFCLRGQVLEIAAADDDLGTVFYTLDQEKQERPTMTRQTESCLLCHGSSSTQGMPGHLVRSLFVDRQGNPLLSSGSYRTDHTSPLEERWGGWYVTGTSGDQMHLGNLISKGSKRPDASENTAGVNVVDLKDRLTISFYPTPHSDIVSLMTLEHQVGMLNRLSRAVLETRMALHYESEMNKAFERPADEQSESARSRIRNVGDAVAKYMLFGGEIPLTGRIEGTSTFTDDFMKRGVRDSKGRSLRDFDLESRLFKYPCSYMIYSRSFESLPNEVKDHVYLRLWEILNGPQGTGRDDPRLTPEDRQAIIEILRETKPGLPDYWETIAPASP